jgi:hypothetical protein
MLTLSGSIHMQTLLKSPPPLVDDEVQPPNGRAGSVPVHGSLSRAYALSLVIAFLIAVASVAGLTLGTPGLYGGDARAALGITASTASIVVPGFRAHDAFNLAVALPILLATVWFARRGALIGLLLWPGALFYLLYTYTLYLVGAPFGPLFLVYVVLVVLSAYTIIYLVATTDAGAVRARLAGGVPARTVGGLLVALALLTVGQDAGGAVATALAGGSPEEPLARHVWATDLVIEVPALLIGGALLWRRAALGYLAGAGLLLQFGMTPLALAAIIALQPWLTGAAIDTTTATGLLVFTLVAFAPLGFYVRAAAAQRHFAALRLRGVRRRV